MDYKTDGFSVAEVMGKGVEKDRPSGAKRVDSDKVFLAGAKPGQVIGTKPTPMRSWRPS